MYIHSDGILVAQAAGGLPWDINVDNSPTPEITQKQFKFLVDKYIDSEHWYLLPSYIYTIYEVIIQQEDIPGI